VLVINPILQYTFYEQLKNILEKRKKVGPRDAFYLGALGKLLATTITYPYITVKSRAHVATKENPSKGMTETLKNIVRDEGWAGLYKGMYPSQTVVDSAC
jgi:solute carrier family 25 (peroxisomal adenine nucleotide transporter), member 17